MLLSEQEVAGVEEDPYMSGFIDHTVCAVMYTDKLFTLYTLKTIWTHVMWYFLVQSVSLYTF